MFHPLNLLILEPLLIFGWLRPDRAGEFSLIVVCRMPKEYIKTKTLLCMIILEFGKPRTLVYFWMAKTIQGWGVFTG
jgi:hypothetical protein